MCRGITKRENALKSHDRPWFERPIFGKVRYMNAAGLERKCDIAAYVDKVDWLVARSA